MNEFRRHGPVLLGAFIGITTGMTSLYFYSLGLFLKPVASDFGWSRSAASLGPLFATLGGAIASIPTGYLMDKIGARPVVIFAMLLLAGGFAALGLLTSGLTSYLLISALISLGTVGSTPLAYTRFIVEKFDRHRGMALGLALTGTGVGASLAPIILAPMIDDHGWRMAYLFLSAVVLVSTIPVAILLRGSPPLSEQSPTEVQMSLKQIISNSDFAVLGSVFFLVAVGILGGIVHFPAMLSDAGLSAPAVGALAGLIGPAVIAGRALTGFLLDRLDTRAITASLFCFSGIGLCLLALFGARAAIPGALTLGLCVGAEVDLIAYLVSRHFAQHAYGRAYGGIYALFLLGGALGPALMGWLFDVSGSYAAPFAGAALFLAMASLLVLRLPRIKTGAS